MGDFGTLTYYVIGQAIRPATAAEWRKTADMINMDFGDSYTGAWLDDANDSVFVDGGPDAEVTDSDITALRNEAASAGDDKQVSFCDIALGADGNSANWSWSATPSQQDARSECVRIILDNRMNVAADA